MSSENRDGHDWLAYLWYGMVAVLAVMFVVERPSQVVVFVILVAQVIAIFTLTVAVGYVVYRSKEVVIERAK